MIFYDINLEVDGKVPRAKCTSLIKSSTSNNNIPQSDKIVKVQPSEPYTLSSDETREVGYNQDVNDFNPVKSSSSTSLANNISQPDNIVKMQLI